MLAFSIQSRGFCTTVFSDESFDFDKAFDDLRRKWSARIWKSVIKNLKSTTVLRLEPCVFFLTHAAIEKKLMASIKLLGVLDRISVASQNNNIIDRLKMVHMRLAAQLFFEKLSRCPSLRYISALNSFLNTIDAKLGHGLFNEEELACLLLLAVELCPLSVIRKLIALGADCESRNQQGQTVVQVAFAYDRYDVVCYLLSDQKVNVNAQDNDGATLLHMAVEDGDTVNMRTMMEYFLCSGINPELSDINGKTAEMLGEESGWEASALAELLHPLRGTKRKLS